MRRIAFNSHLSEGGGARRNRTNTRNGAPYTGGGPGLRGCIRAAGSVKTRRKAT